MRHSVRAAAFFAGLSLVVVACATGAATPSVGPMSGPSTGPTATATATATPTATVTATATAKPQPAFEVNGKPFRFLGAFIPGYYWSDWSKANDVALVAQAKQAGFTVLHLMLPGYEKTLGRFDETALRELDHFMDEANKNGMYVEIPFIHGLSLATQTDSPYSNPGGVEGLIDQPKLRAAFKAHMAKLVTRVNTVNRRKYSEDPTVLSWMVIEEIVSAPPNYPKGFPNITPSEIADWLQENAAYVKSLDPNHLVSINTTAAVDAFDGLGEDWKPILQVPALDYFEAEDAEARIVNNFNQMYTFDAMYLLGKPVVAMLSYTGGGVDRAKYCNDYSWQASMMQQVADLYMTKGAAGFTIFSWRLKQVAPEECYSYSTNSKEIMAAMKYISGKLGAANVVPKPLALVGLTK